MEETGNHFFKMYEGRKEGKERGRKIRRQGGKKRGREEGREPMHVRKSPK